MGSVPESCNSSVETCNKMVRGAIVSALALCLLAASVYGQGDINDAQVGRVDCASQRGYGECREIGQDCTQQEVTNDAGQAVVRVTFPLKQHNVSFPCTDGFAAPPIILPEIHGGDNTKLYTTSVSGVTTHMFTVNVQRVDDVDEPNMACTPLSLCYVAIVPKA